MDYSKALTVYFSAEGHTAEIAKRVHETAGGEIFEIKPLEPYTKSDLNWKNPIARCNKEKIKKKDVDFVDMPVAFNESGTVFIGFPIWYYSAPAIITTFMKKFDWTGKRIALFATSGGSDIGKTVGKLRPFCEGARIIAAKVFKEEDNVEEWTQEIAR